MILSHARRFIFIHSPKTGGTALSLALEARAKSDDILIGDTPKAVARRRRLADLPSLGRKHKHMTLADGIGLYSPQQAQDYFTLTLVRNPWDRMVSYYHWLRGQQFDHPAVHLAKAMAFDAFLAHADTQTSIRAAPYASYMRLPDGAECCKLYLRLESIDTDAAPLEAHLGFAITPLARVNASERDRDYRPYYSDASARIVADICAEDIAHFGYSFES